MDTHTKYWGKLGIIDLRGCNIDVLEDKNKLLEFSSKICFEIKMIPHGKPLINRFGEGELGGFSLMQFIKTSSIVVHADEHQGRVFIDIFSCKEFDIERATNFAKVYFMARDARFQSIYRF